MSKKFSLFSLLLGMLIFLIVGCSSQEQNDASEKNQENHNQIEEPKTITIKDSTGKEIELEYPVKRAIVINRNTAEALKMLGIDKEIIATGDTVVENNPYLGFEHLPDVGKTSELNLELILSLKPDVVFTYTNRPDSTLEEKLEPAGIKVVRMNNYLPNQMNEELTLLGELFQKEERASYFLEWKAGLEKMLADRVSEIPEDEKKRVIALSVGALNSDGIYRIFPSETIGGEPGAGEGYATILSGGIDATDVKWNNNAESTTVLVDEEYVLDKNPEVITFHGTWLGGYKTEDSKEFEEVYQNIIHTTSVPKLKAFENKNIIFYHTNFIGSDKRYIGALQLAKDLYPERFSDIHPEIYAREYFEKWLGVEYKGIWYYNPNH